MFIKIEIWVFKINFFIYIDLQNECQATYVTVPPIGPDDLPPPYSPSPHGVPMITCKVCGFMIDISGRRDQHVVKCSSCNEATVSTVLL